MAAEHRAPPPHAHAAPFSNGRSSAVVRRQQLNMAPYNAVLEYRGVPHHMGRASTPHASPSQGRASTPHGSSRPPKAGGGGDSSLPVLAQHPRQKSPGAYEQAALQSVGTHHLPSTHSASRQLPWLLTRGSPSLCRLCRPVTPFRAARAMVGRNRPVATAGPDHVHGAPGGRSAVDPPTVVSEVVATAAERWRVAGDVASEGRDAAPPGGDATARRERVHPSGGLATRRVS